MKARLGALLALLMSMAAGLACARMGREEIIYVTATFPGGERVLTVSPTPLDPTNTPLRPTPNPTRDALPAQAAPRPTLPTSGGTYVVQRGDTLAVIAAAAGVTVAELMALNGLTNPDLLIVGQVLQLPTPVAGATPAPLVGTTSVGPNFKIIPDSELVYGPTASDFNLTAYIKEKDGFLRVYSQERDRAYVSGVELLNEVAKNYSVNPRLLLALLEYRGSWLSNPIPDEMRREYPLGLVDVRSAGFHKQLLDAANLLNAGYYGWKYRGLTTLTFADGRQVTLAPDLNPGTAAVQTFFSAYNTLEGWQADVSETGFFQTYLALFGDSFLNALEPLVPANLTQPVLTFPFPPNETWYYTGGPHGGYNSGSAWASIDFAPPAPPDALLAQEGFCYVSPFFVTAVAAGIVARSGEGFLILDLDFDGDEHTGWTIVYLHVADNAALTPAGTRVNVGDKLGNPSCQGGFSNATHLHIGRRYNGEWMGIDCENCPSTTVHVPFVMSGWTVRGYIGQEYQGYMENAAGEFRRANVGREDPINRVVYSK